MADIPGTPEAQRYLSCVGSVIVQWTITESYVQGLILRIIGANHKSFALVAGMSGQPLINLFRVVTSESAEFADKEVLEHLATCMELARPWRDYLAHGLKSVIHNPGDRVFGYFATSGGRRAPDNRQDLFTLDEIENTLSWMNELELYARKIRLAFESRIDIKRMPGTVLEGMPDYKMQKPPKLDKTPLITLLHPYVIL